MKQKSSTRKSSKSIFHNEYLTFFQHLLDSLSKFDFPEKNICFCQSYNRNMNAFETDNNEQQPSPQLYPHIRKVYNDETDLLEQVYIIMSTIKPECSVNQEQQVEEETIAQRRRRRTRVSKQRAKALITEYSTRNLVDKLKNSRNKRNHSSLGFSLL